MASRCREVLALYKAILRLGREQLQLTDQVYFRRMVEREFRRNVTPREVAFQIEVRGANWDDKINEILHFPPFFQKGNHFLKSDLGGMR